jgi:hypothetical protein
LRRRTVASAAAVALLAVTAAGCGGKSHTRVTAGPDETICVYDVSTKLDKGSDTGTHGFIDRVPPNTTMRFTHKETDLLQVSLPTSVRFYAAVPDPGTRDAGAPSSYSTSDASGIQMGIPIQVGFRFNQAKACKWYTQYGHRNADSEGKLGFDKGTGVATGWTSFLNQYLGLTMTDVVTAMGQNYNWYSLYYHYPKNADENGEIPKGESRGLDSVTAFETAAATTFSKKLNTQLGDEYFCAPSSEGSNCAPMTVKIFGRPIVKQSLIDARETLAEQRQQLQNDAALAKYRAEHLKNIVNNEANAQKAIQAQIRSTQLSADLALLRAQAEHPYCWQVAKNGRKQCPESIYKTESQSSGQTQNP